MKGNPGYINPQRSTKPERPLTRNEIIELVQQEAGTMLEQARFTTMTRGEIYWMVCGELRVLGWQHALSDRQKEAIRTDTAAKLFRRRRSAAMDEIKTKGDGLDVRLTCDTAKRPIKQPVYEYDVIPDAKGHDEITITFRWHGKRQELEALDLFRELTEHLIDDNKQHILDTML